MSAGASRPSHHDTWDYDIGSQPVLTDMRMGGAVVPAILVPTKRGEIFVLDRRTGKPLVKTVERAVPQGPAPGDRLSPTQPFVEGFPDLHPGRSQGSLNVGGDADRSAMVPDQLSPPPL